MLLRRNFSRFPFSVFVVSEESMLPSYKPGAHVVTFNWLSIGKDDVIVFKSESKHYIKRVYKKVYNYVYIKGDNEAKSAKMGPIKVEQIVGKVIFSY